jgi:hypothetical protein
MNPFSHGETLKVLVDPKTPLMSLRHLSNDVGADGILLLPGFQFPVKELVASLKDLKGELTKLSFFCIIYKWYLRIFYE